MGLLRNPRKARGNKSSEPAARAPDATMRMQGAFWSAQKIMERQRTDGLFWLPGPAPDNAPLPYELDPARLRAASYNLRMGSETYVTPVSDSDPKSVQQLDVGQAFRIPPGQFAFLLTSEAIHVPDDTFALVALRARELQFKGLINVSGFHIDPGYNGRLVLAVYNAGPGEVHLREGQILFEIFFADLDRPTDRSYNQQSNKKPLFRIEPDIIAGVAGQFETLKGLRNRIDDVESDLNERIHAIEREQSLTRWASALIIGALITFGVKECSSSQPQAPVSTEGVAHD